MVGICEGCVVVVIGVGRGVGCGYVLELVY